MPGSFSDRFWAGLLTAVLDYRPLEAAESGVNICVSISARRRNVHFAFL